MLLLLILLTICTLSISAQPSGGPYGPIRQVYELPETHGKIYYVAPDGNARASGESLSHPTTIEAAIGRVTTGDVIVMRGGVYRTGDLMLNQGITIQPYRDEQPVLKGTYVATEWNELGDGIWSTSWSRLFPSEPADWWRREREGMRTPLHRFHNDMVFINGVFLQSAGWEGEVDEGTFYIDYDRELVFIGVDPTDRLVEITAYDVAIYRTTANIHNKSSDGRGYTLRGLTFTQYAFRALEIDGTNPEGISDEADHGKDVIGTTIEHVTISYCSRVAGYLRGDSLTIRHSKITDTSTEGIFILSSNDVLLERNIFKRNNIEHITGYYPAAVKIFNQCYRVTVNDNLVIDHPNSNGIWYDVGNVDGVFTNNWIEGVGTIDGDSPTDNVWPSDNGFFFEISKGVIATGNVFVNNDQGMLILNSSDAHIYNNTFINSRATFARNERSAEGDHFGWHPSTGPDVDERDGHVFVNNLLVGDYPFDRPLLFTWQRATLCERLNKSMLGELDNNVYVHGTNSRNGSLIVWSPAPTENCQIRLDLLDDLHKLHREHSKNSMSLRNYDGPLFKSIELRNLELLPEFPGLEVGTHIPEEIGKHPKGNGKYIGAYPPYR
jgi:parallel beta-helix repeat protein